MKAFCILTVISLPLMVTGQETRPVVRMTTQQTSAKPGTQPTTQQASVQPATVIESVTGAWNGSPGGGTQWILPEDVEFYLGGRK